MFQLFRDIKSILKNFNSLPILYGHHKAIVIVIRKKKYITYRCIQIIYYKLYRINKEDIDEDTKGLLYEWSIKYWDYKEIFKKKIKETRNS